MPIEQATNNPLGLTVAGPGYGNPNAVLYPGQTGAQTSGLGYTFAQFPDVSAGFNAGVQYIADKINSGKVTNVGQLVSLFGPSDINAFTAAGFSANSPVTASNASEYAQLVATGEGNASVLSNINVGEGLGAALLSGGNAATTLAAVAPGVNNPSPLGSLQSFGLIIVGSVIVVVALWQLLSDHGVVPSPVETVKGAGKLAVGAVAAV